MRIRSQARVGPWAVLGVLIVMHSGPALAQLPALTIESLTAGPGRGGATTVVDTTGGASVTLVFRIMNAAPTAQSLITRVNVPQGWQSLFVSGRLDVPAQRSIIETVTIAAPRNAAAGDYLIRYEARLSPSDTPVTSTVTVRVAVRRQVVVSWLDARAYFASTEPATFDLVVSNEGNRTEIVNLDVRSSLGAPLRSSWTGGAIDAGATQRVRVVRQPVRVRQDIRETLTATAEADGLHAVAEANLGFDVVPEGRAPDPGRRRLPTMLAFRAGTGRSPQFGSFVGSGSLDAGRTKHIDFGFVSRDRSHPLMFERDRNYLNITAPDASFAAGDHTWALSYLTESGHYGLGVGGKVERPHWSAGGFIDTGRHDVTEGSQAGVFLGLNTGHVAALSTQYLARFADDLRSARVADIGSLRLVLKPALGFTGDFEAGIGQSSEGTGKAVSGLVSFTSRMLSIYGRRVRRDEAYPVRDRTGLIDGAGLSLRPFGQLQLEGTVDGTGQIEDPTLPIDAPTRQRITRARASWGSLASVTAGRIEWTSPGRGWSAEWRRTSVAAELRIPLGAAWLAPGVERGTEATPSYRETPFSLNWLQAGVRLGARNSADVRVEYGRGDAGVADRIVRRVSFGAALQPIDATRLTVRVSNGARDALWLQGAQWATATLNQRLPWRHHIVAEYKRRTGGGSIFVDEEAYRVDYVIPIGMPLRSAGDTARITVRLHDAETGQPRPGMLVQISGQSRLTDRDGVVAFTGLRPGDYHVTVAPDSLGPGRSVVPLLPFKVSVKGGDRAEVKAAVVRTGTITGTLQMFQATTAGRSGQPAALVAGAGIANALIELVVAGEHRTAVTDAQGRFSFEEVPPGSWQVRIVRAEVPPFYALEEAVLNVKLDPAGKRHLVFRVIPKSQ